MREERILNFFETKHTILAVAHLVLIFPQDTKIIKRYLVYRFHGISSDVERL